MSFNEYIQSTPQEFNGHPLTCLPSPIDQRDYKYPLLVQAIGAKPVTVGPIDYRDNLPPVFNQMHRGSCVAAANTWTTKAFQEISEGDFPKGGLSAAYLYARCKEIDGIPNSEGTYMRTAMQVLQKHGVPPEDALPYYLLANLPAPQVPKIPALADAQAGQFKIATYAQLCNYTDTDADRTGLLATIRQALVREGPFVMALLVCSNFTPDEKGRLPLPGGTTLGGHAVGIVGDLPDIGCLILRNSWGREWGLDGYAFLPYEWLTRSSDTYRYVFEAWTCVDITTPRAAKQIVVTPNSTLMEVDGVFIQLDQEALVTDMGRMMIPLRAVGGNMGYVVDWDGKRAILTRPY